MTEIMRLLRHIFAPLVMLLVAKGYLPEYMQDDVIELLVVIASILLPMAFSWWRDRRRGRA